ncbi:MAG: hypothetical protein KGM24_00470 [Elusimicrobia bacterium]|nr:hypothetical protein [Elusimicrobiota bacterium]
MPPRVSIERLPRTGRYGGIEPGRVYVGDCRGVASKLNGVQIEELAVVRLTAYTPWYVSVERVARDKAGELGANCLTKRSTWGAGSYPFSVSYDAYRITRQWGFGLRAPWFPVPKKELADAASPAKPASAAPAAASSPAPAADTSSSAGSPGQPDVPLWTSGNFVFRFVLGLDTAKFTPAVWQDVQQDFKEYFPAAQYARLLDAHKRGGRILVDFKSLKITELPAHRR